MSIQSRMREIAAEYARAAQQRVSRLEREALDLKAALDKKEAERDAARGAPKRLANFQVKSGTDYQCPRCWVEDETRAALSAIGGGTDTEDLFRCRKCKTEFSVPF